MHKLGAVILTSIAIVLCGFGNRSRPYEMKKAAQLSQKLTKLTEADQKRLSDQRAVVEKYLSDESSGQKH